MGRYVSQPLTVQCHTIREVQEFLATCDYVSDKELFGKDEYWQPPEDFEKRKKGDCEDFALWTWRQLLNMGYDARFIGGRSGRYGEGHAWVEYFQDGKCFLLEALFRKVGTAMPRLSTLRYEPKLSVSWDGEKLKYFSHKQPQSGLSWRVVAPLILEYIAFWGWFWLKNFYRIPLGIGRILKKRLFNRELWLQGKKVKQ